MPISGPRKLESASDNFPYGIPNGALPFPIPQDAGCLPGKLPAGRPSPPKATWHRPLPSAAKSCRRGLQARRPVARQAPETLGHVLHARGPPDVRPPGTDPRPRLLRGAGEASKRARPWPANYPQQSAHPNASQHKQSSRKFPAQRCWPQTARGQRLLTPQGATPSPKDISRPLSTTHAQPL